MFTKTAALLLILSVFAFACGKEKAGETKAAHNEETAVGTPADTTTVAKADDAKNLLVMQYYALPG